MSSQRYSLEFKDAAAKRAAAAGATGYKVPGVGAAFHSPSSVQGAGTGIAQFQRWQT